MQSIGEGSTRREGGKEVRLYLVQEAAIQPIVVSAYQPSSHAPEGDCGDCEEMWERTWVRGAETGSASCTVRGKSASRQTRVRGQRHKAHPCQSWLKRSHLSNPPLFVGPCVTLSLLSNTGRT